MTSSPIRVIDLITTDHDKKFEPAGCLASAIVSLLQQKRQCRPSELVAIGFAAEEVDAYWHMAHALALVEIHLMPDENLNEER